MARFNANQSQNQSYVCSIGVFLGFANKRKVYIVFTHRRESFKSTRTIRHCYSLATLGISRLCLLAATRFRLRFFAPADGRHGCGLRPYRCYYFVAQRRQWNNCL